MAKNAYLTTKFKDFKARSANVGDYIQVIAALKIIEQNEKRLIPINREEFSLYNKKAKPGTKLIANGWYSHNNKTFPVHENLIPLFISVHVNESFKMTDTVIETFKKYEPIGCRDITTEKKLKSFGIDAYFSGCLTLTLPEVKKKRKGIVFVLDTINEITSFSELTKWKGYEFLKNELLKEFTIEQIKNAKFMTQFTRTDFSEAKQFRIARRWLKTLYSAELVVTSRIHSLMPSMAMGTPSLYIMKNINDSRFEGLVNFWNYIDYTDLHLNNTVSAFIKRNKDGKIINNNSFRELAEISKMKVKNFWEEEHE